MEKEKQTYYDRSPRGSRKGKKQLIAHFDPSIVKEVKLLMANRKTNLQVLLNEAVALLLEKYRDKFK